MSDKYTPKNGDPVSVIIADINIDEFAMAGIVLAAYKDEFIVLISGEHYSYYDVVPANRLRPLNQPADEICTIDLELVRRAKLALQADIRYSINKFRLCTNLMPSSITIDMTDVTPLNQEEKQVVVGEIDINI